MMKSYYDEVKKSHATFEIGTPPKMAPQDSYLFLNFLEQKDDLADVIVHACNPVLTLERPRQGSREFEANLSYILVSKTNNKVKYSSTSKLSLKYK